MQQTANHAVTEGVAAPEKAPLAAPSRARAAELSASAGNRSPTLDRADRWVWTAALGIALMQKLAGYIVQLTGSYSVLFMISASAYLVALGVIHLLAPRLEQAKLD